MTEDAAPSPSIWDVLEACADGVVLIDLHGDVIASNAKFAEMWQISPETLHRGGHESVLEYTASLVTDPERHCSISRELRTHPTAIHQEVVQLLDGREFELNTRPFWSGGEFVGRVWSIHDITPYKTMEHELRWKTAFMEAQLNSTMEGVLVVDANGNKIFENNQLIKMWNVPQHIIDDPDDQAQLAYVVRRTRNPEAFLERVMYLYAHPQEESRDEIEFTNGTVLDRYSAPVIGKDGTNYGRIWSFRDVTELVRTREKAEAASLAKSSFLANMSHEIRTPLNGVIGMTSLLLAQPLDEDSKDMVNTIQKSGETLLRVINDVLDFSKIEANRLEIEPCSTNIATLVEDVVALYQMHAIESGITLKSSALIDRDVALPNVMVDPVRLRQVLSNLVGNAVKFTHEGQVVVEWNIALEGENAELQFCVSDTGIGIPADRLSVVFDSFTQADVSIQRKYGGTGLGLAISKKLVDLMGGTIWATSEISVGSRFWLEFATKVDKVVEPAASRPEAATTLNSNLRILLAEDNPINVMVTSKVLDRLGLECDVAENGMAAISMALEGNYDLILMDVMMPVCDGLESTRAIRGFEEQTARPRLPILALSASAMREDREACIEAGMDDFVAKPFTVDSIREALCKWLPDAALVKAAA